MSTQKSQEDLDFEAKLAKAFYKTTSKNYGAIDPKSIINTIQLQMTNKKASMASSPM